MQDVPCSQQEDALLDLHVIKKLLCTVSTSGQAVLTVTSLFTNVT